MLKRLFASSLVQTLIGRTIGLYMRLVAATTRWRRVNQVVAEEVWTSGGPAIAAVWHGRFFLLRAAWDHNAQPPKMLISQSREGGVAAYAARTVGADVVRGSSAKGDKDKGGFAAMREMLRHLNADGGGSICLTPDGPRGPRMRASLGPITLAKLSGAPIVPVAWSTNARKVMQSWDRFILPFPFGRGAIVYGEIVRVPRDADDAAMETARLELETQLNRVAAEADRLAGVPIIEPADPRQRTRREEREPEQASAAQ